MKQFRIVHYPIIFAVLVLFFFFVLNLSTNKAIITSKEEQFEFVSREIIEENASSKRFSERNSDFNSSNNRGSLLFSNMGMRNSFKIDNFRQNTNEKGGLKDKVLFPGLRIVHLDLKGAPPKISYLQKIFPIISKLGANGLLIEYEDMFPYGGGPYVARNAYSKKDIADLLKAAKDSKLEVIPLLQTFGHAEFVLKLRDYKHLRENPRYPQAYCPSKNETLRLLERLINSVLDAHPDSRYFHIGCDEVFSLGECDACRTAMETNGWDKRKLFLNHIQTIVEYINSHYPRIQVLMWDDELRSWSIADLEESGLGQLIQPIVWKYTSDVSTSFPPSFWTKYSTVFKHVWIASAFKGASSPDATALDLDVYTTNHEAWMDTVASNSKYVNFAGIILTGWQRYDHFSVLCELLPVAFPSLAVNLAYVSGNDQFIGRLSYKMREELKCDSPLSFKPVNGVTNRCGFPGAGVYEAVSFLSTITDAIGLMKQNNAFKGWFTKYNIDKHFSSPALIEQSTADLDIISNELLSLELKLTEKMDEIYDKSTIDEWLTTYLRPHQDEIRRLIKARSSLLLVDDWPRRPLFNSKGNSL